MSRQLAVRGGLYTIVSDEDFERLNKKKWAVSRGYVCDIGHNRPLHREVMELPDGDPRQVDHINQDKFDNTRENLRVCSAAENNRNRRAIIGRASRYKGVTLDARTGKWIAGIGLGSYTEEIDAARAYDNAAVLIFGEYAAPNFPDAMRKSLTGRR